MRLLLLLSLLAVLGCNRQASRIDDTTGGPFAAPAPASAPGVTPATPSNNPQDLRPEDNPDLRATIETAESNGEGDEGHPRTVSPRNPNYDARKQKSATPAPGTMEQGAGTQVPGTPMMSIDPKALQARPVVSLRKTPCYGDCPVYTITVLSSELATLDAKRGTKKAGKQLRELSHFDYADLVTQVAKVTGGELADRYPVEGEVPADIAFTELVFTDEDGKSRTVQVYADAPEPLAELIDTLVELATGFGWQ